MSIGRGCDCDCCLRWYALFKNHFTNSTRIKARNTAEKKECVGRTVHVNRDTTINSFDKSSRIMNISICIVVSLMFLLCWPCCPHFYSHCSVCVLFCPLFISFYSILAGSRHYLLSMCLTFGGGGDGGVVISFLFLLLDCSIFASRFVIPN